MAVRARVQRPVAVRSAWLLRALASITTLLSFGAMASFAAGHLYEASAPLRPVAPAAAVPAPTPRPLFRSAPSGDDDGGGDDGGADDGRVFVSPQIPTTNAVPLTRTRQSGG